MLVVWYCCIPQTTWRVKGFGAIIDTAMALSHTECDKMLIVLEQHQDEFFAEPFHFSWWVHGGEPGSPSDYFELFGEGGRIIGKYVRARFNPDKMPPMVSEQFTASLRSSEAAKVMLPALKSELFCASFAQEHKPEVADIQLETWELRKNDSEAQKTLYEPFPRELESLRLACRKTIDFLMESGEHTLRTPPNNAR
jgi:hypothetical protein